MILVDTSVWVDVLRGDRSDAARRIRTLVSTQPDLIATTEPVIMELLAGAKNASMLAQLDRLVASMSLLPLESATDFTDAAELYRTCRSQGVTVRKMVDCLIASVALRHGAVLWHKDADFEAIASIAPLETVDLR